MKKTLLICLIAIVALTGCKKDKNATTQKLVGKWMATKEVEKEFTNGTLTSTDTDTYSTNEFVIEFTSNELKVYDDGDLDGTYPYTVSGNTITYKEDGREKIMNVNFNNDNEIVIVQEDTDVDNDITHREVVETTFVRK